MTQEAGDALSFGDFCLHPRERRLERDGRLVRVGDRALDILIALTERPGDVVTKEELTARLWPDVTVQDGALRVHVAGLRKALGDGKDGVECVKNVTGRGYAFVARTSRSTTSQRSSSSRPAAPGAVGTRKLPYRLERMIGRDEVVRDLSAQLLAKRFVSIVGAGGIGKTTVAVAVAHALLSDFAEDVCFVDLSSVAESAHVPLGVASALGLALNGDQVADGIVAFLRDRRALVVLDGCEHVMEAVAPLAERVSRDAPGTHVLVTSRELLRVEGEHVYRMLPLETPSESDGLSASDALKFSAVQLFVERAAARDARLSFSDVDAPLVADICRRLDGIALAIEFAAGRVEAHGIRGTVSLLENRFKLSWRGRRTALPRHQTLSALLDWSYNLLDALERSLLRRLSIFVGVFSLDAVAALAADVDAEEAVDALGSLVDKSLVATVEVGGTGALYRLLDTTRAYAQAKLDESGERLSVAARHATYLCELLEQESRMKSGSPERLPVNQLGSARAALEWAFSQTGDTKLGSRLAAASVPMFLDLSLLHECYRWVELALSSLEPAKRGTRQEMELQAALSTAAMFTRGNGADARAALDRAIALADAINEPREQLRLLGALHILLTRTGEHEDALAAAQRAGQLASMMPMDPAARALAEWMTATSQHLLGDQIGAEPRCRTALNRSPASRSTAMLYFSFDHRIRALVVLARTRWLLGRADDALRVAADAVHDAALVGQPTTVAISLIYSFSVYLWSGEIAAAASIVEELLKHTEKHSLAPYHAVALGEKGQLLIHRGDFTGVELLRHAIDVLGTGRHLLLQSTFYSALAEGLAGLGLFADALRAIDLAIAETTRTHGRSFDAPEILRIKGSLLADKPEPDDQAAEKHLLDAIKHARGHSALGWELRAATTLSRLWARGNRRPQARELLGSTYERFAQGFGTADLVEARKLLATL
jgi:predicted ATPase/DNA-binding winged helix-turn-helix (wHTH) protein